MTGSAGVLILRKSEVLFPLFVTHDKSADFSSFQMMCHELKSFAETSHVKINVIIVQ